MRCVIDTVVDDSRLRAAAARAAAARRAIYFRVFVSFCFVVVVSGAAVCAQ
jgi:hypothetical protein